jgi:hypothetical protein
MFRILMRRWVPGLRRTDDASQSKQAMCGPMSLLSFCGKLRVNSGG